MRLGQVVMAAVFLVACGSPSNTAFIPIGSRCVASSDCGTTPYDCDTSQPGGYCERPCSIEPDCPTDATCASTGHCRRRCITTDDCRKQEGYVCADVHSVSFACVQP